MLLSWWKDMVIAIALIGKNASTWLKQLINLFIQLIKLITLLLIYLVGLYLILTAALWIITFLST